MKRWLTNGLLATTSLGVVTLLGALWHAQAYTVRRRTVILPGSPQSDGHTGFDARAGSDAPDPDTTSVTPGSPSQLRILHISDIHLLACQRKRRTFLRSLAQLEPDFVVFTGDLISENDAISALAEDLKELSGIPGAFVFGSNDYYWPTLKNPFTYLFRHTGISDVFGTADTSEKADAFGTSNGKIPEKYQPLNTDRLRTWLTDCGWLDMNNTRAQVQIGDWQLDLVGVDDPHIGRDQFPDPVPDSVQDNKNTTTRVSDATHASDVEHTNLANLKKLRIGIAHAPYTWLLDMMAADGSELLFAGHTHGGQVNVPGSHALVTNCDLPARFAKGLFSWKDSLIAVDDDDAAEVITKNGAVVMGKDMLVNISAGIGTSPFTPVRTFCAPEAIILDIISPD